jgi:hypothetical protein
LYIVLCIKAPLRRPSRLLFVALTLGEKIKVRDLMYPLQRKIEPSHALRAEIHLDIVGKNFEAGHFDLDLEGKGPFLFASPSRKGLGPKNESATGGSGQDEGILPIGVDHLDLSASAEKPNEALAEGGEGAAVEDPAHDRREIVERPRVLRVDGPRARVIGGLARRVRNLAPAFLYQGNEVGSALDLIEAFQFAVGETAARYDVFRLNPVENVAFHVEPALVAGAESQVLFFVFELKKLVDHDLNSVLHDVPNVHHRSSSRPNRK